jgi:hypothetical protein
MEVIWRWDLTTQTSISTVVQIGPWLENAVSTTQLLLASIGLWMAARLDQCAMLMNFFSSEFRAARKTQTELPTIPELIGLLTTASLAGA